MQSADVKKSIPAISYLTSVLGDPAVRYRGTIGGSIANNDPAADFPAALASLGATVKTNKRSISADDFFKGLFTTALDDGEIITAVSFPIPAKAGYAKFRHPASRFALTGVFVTRTKAGDVRVAATGASQDGVMRVSAIEAALKANWSAAAIDSVKVSASGLMSDIHGTSDYRANLIKVMAQRAVTPRAEHDRLVMAALYPPLEGAGRRKRSDATGRGESPSTRALLDVESHPTSVRIANRSSPSRGG